MTQQDSNANAAGRRSGDTGASMEQIDLRLWVDVLWSGRWWIVGFVAAAILFAVLYLLDARPVYQADALIRIEEKGSSLGGMESFENLGDGKPETSAQMEILRSRRVLGGAVDRLNLTISAEPNRLPILYPLFSEPGDEPAEPWMGLSRYAWGGEHIELGNMDVPSHLRGTPFTLVAGEDGAYKLRGPKGAHVLDGQAGDVVSGEFNGAEISLFVQELVARPGTTFTVKQNSRLGAIGALRSQLTATEKGKDTGVVELLLAGHDRTRIEHILATVADVYLQQNQARRSAEARESLKFIEGQLPELRSQVSEAEGQLSEYQQREEMVDLSAQTQSMLQKLVSLDGKISELERRRAEASQTYGEQHPVIEAIDVQLSTVREEKAQIESRISGLPEKQREMLSLKRELEVSTEVYTEMMNNAQELRVAEAGTVGNVRIIDDAAVSGGPIAPKSMQILLGSAFLGGILGCGLVIGRRFMQRGVETPDELEQRTGLSVYSVVPHSAVLRRGDRRYERGGRETAPLLAVEGAEDPATEALRSLRTSLHFGLSDPGHRVLAITSPGPKAGKSTISINLAMLLAEIGQSVVLVDGDMRRGHMGRYIGSEGAGAGLSDVLAGTHSGQDVIHPLPGSGRASVILKGTTPPNPSELLLSERYGELIAELREAYDWVIVDGPPIMAVTDAAIIAHEASATFLVVRAARDEVDEVTGAMRRLEQSGGSVTGLILNDYGASQVGRKYQTYYYRYDYRSKEKGKAKA